MKIMHINMKGYWALTLILSLLFVAAPISLAAEKTNSEALDALKVLLSPLEALQGQFSQDVLNDQGKSLQKSAGKVWLKKPGQFRWEVQGQDPRLVVSDGNQVWDYDKELSQVTIQRFSKGQSSAPIYFLTGNVNSIDKDFKVNFIKLNQPQCLKHSDRCFELLPRSDDDAFQVIQLGFKDKTLKEIILVDQLGQHSEFVFDNIVANANIEPEIFKFKPPKGVEVVRAN